MKACNITVGKQVTPHVSYWWSLEAAVSLAKGGGVLGYSVSYHAEACMAPREQCSKLCPWDTRRPPTCMHCSMGNDIKFS